MELYFKLRHMEIWHAARKQAMTPKVVESAWQKAEFLPFDQRMFDLQATLSQLPQVDALLPSSRPTTAGGPVLIRDSMTASGAVSELQVMLDQVQEGEVKETERLILIEKIGNAATKVMVYVRATQAINQDLVEGASKKGRGKRETTRWSIRES